MSVLGNFTQRGAIVDFRGCEAHEGYGGGLAVLHGSFRQLTGKMHFNGCSADAGGGLFVKQTVSVSDVMAFGDCKASSAASGGSGNGFRTQLNF